MKTLDAVTLGLATARLTQLVVDDEITEPIRDAVQRRSLRQATSAGVTYQEVVQPWDTVDTVISCHACTSVWAGGGILVAEQTRVGRFLVRVLALSQAALTVKSVIERIDR